MAEFPVDDRRVREERGGQGSLLFRGYLASTRPQKRAHGPPMAPERAKIAEFRAYRAFLRLSRTPFPFWRAENAPRAFQGRRAAANSLPQVPGMLSTTGACHQRGGGHCQ